MVDTRPFDYLFKVRERAERGDNTHARIVFFLSTRSLSRRSRPSTQTRSSWSATPGLVSHPCCCASRPASLRRPACRPLVSKEREGARERGAGAGQKTRPAQPLSSFPVSPHTHIQRTGVDFRLKFLELQGKRLKLTIWDTAGQVKLEEERERKEKRVFLSWASPQPCTHFFLSSFSPPSAGTLPHAHLLLLPGRPGHHLW